MIKCPNKNLRDYQELERLRGPQEARMLWMLHDGIVPESEYVKTYYGIMNLPGNEYLYEKYNLLNKKGEIKTVPYNTPAQMERTNEWVRRLNLSPFYAFKLGKAASGMKIFIYEKEPSAIDEKDLPMYKTAEEEAEKDFYYQNTVDRVNEIKMLDSIMNKLDNFDTYIRNSPESNALLSEILINQYGLIPQETDFIFSLEEESERKGNNISFLISKRYSKYTSDEIAINRINKLKALQFDVELEKRLVDFTSSLEITHEVVDDLKGRFNVDALGVADIVNRIIYLSKERRLDTFPEEVAHFYVELLGYKEGVGKELFDKITFWNGYQAVYEEYKDIYKRRDGAIDEVKIKKEAIAKTIAEAIVKNYVIQSDNFSAEEKDFWTSLINFLKRIFERFRNSSYVPLEGITNDIATKILNNDISDITKRVQAVAEKNRQLKTFDGTLENYPFARKVIEEVNKLGGLLTGSLAIRKQGTLYRNEDETVHDLDFSVDWRFYEGDYEKFVDNFKEIFPNYRQISRKIFSGNSGEYVLNGMITDDDSLYERFTNLKGDFNSRLDTFTLEEQGKMLLIDFFFYPEGRVTPSFEGTELAENVFAAKSFMGMRNKDAFDLLSYIPNERPTGLSEYSYLQATPIKPGVENIFNENLELTSIGTPEQYSQYLDTVFPDSKVKDIVYHGSKNNFTEFLKEFLGSNTPEGSTSSKIGFYFSKDKFSASTYTLTKKDFDEIEEVINVKKNTEEYVAIKNALGTLSRLDAVGDPSLEESLSKEDYLKVLKQQEKEANDIIDKLTPIIDAQNIEILKFVKNSILDKLKNKNVFSVVLDIKNPLTSNKKQVKFNNAELIKGENKAKELGRDSLIYNAFDSNVEGIFETESTDNYVVFEPEQIHILGSQKDIEGFKDFVEENNTQELPSFKTDEFYNIRPENSLNFIEQQQFKNSIEVGDVVTFSYWSETTSKIESVKDVLITEIEDDRFHGNYQNDEGRTFKLINIINTTPPAKYSLADKNNFKKNLKLRKSVKIFVDNQPIAGAVKEIKEDSMVLDTNQGEVEINFDDIDKENYERNVIRAVTEVKEKLQTHLRIISQKVETEEQIQRISAIRKALDQLENFKQLQDLVEFLESINKSVEFSQALMRKLVDENIVLEKKLAMISFIKQYIDSFSIMQSLNREIQKLEAPEFNEMKEVSRKLLAMISETSDDYYNRVTPIIGKWLYSVFPESINKDLIMLDEKPITEETIIEQLRDPRGDLDFLNTYLVPLSNANDATGGLFSKIMAKAFEGARMLTYKTERELMPLFDKVKEKYGDMNEVYKKMYRLKEITVTEKGKKVKKIVREFIQSENVEPYYDRIAEFNNKANAIQEEIDAIQAQIERGNLSYEERGELFDKKKEKINEKKLVYQARNEYREIYGRVQTAEEVAEIMAKFRDPQNPRYNIKDFNDYLDFYYRITENPTENYITVVDEESGETFYYEYKDNKWIANKDAINPDTGEKVFSTKEYEDLVNGDPDVFALYKAMKKIYDELQYKIPENRRLNGLLPSMWESAPAENLWKSLKNMFVSKDLQYLTDSDNKKQYLVQVDGTPYKQIPIGLSKPLDVSESSDNILSSLLMYASEVNLYRAKSDILGAVNILTDVVDKNKPLDETQKTKQRVETNKRADAIRKFINQVFYGEKRSGNAWWDKALDYLGLATAASRMVLKPSTALANIIVGNYANLAEAVGRRNFTPEDLRVAYAQYFDMLFTDRKKLDNILLSLDAIQGMYNKEVGDYFRTRREKFGFDTLFTLQDLGEREIQGVAALALLNSWKVPIPQDGVFDTATLPDNFLETLRELNKSNNGVYNDFDRLYMQDNSVFRLFLQFRKYVIPTFRSRYSGLTEGWREGNSRNKYRIDYQAGKVEMGYYRAMAGFMWDTVTSFKNATTLMQRFDNLNPIEKEGVIRSIQDGLAVFAITLILLPLAGADDEEATKEALESGAFLNWAHWEYIYQLARLRGDIQFYMMFFGFKDQMRAVNKPFAGASFLEQVYKLSSMFVDFEEDSEGNISIWKQYERKYGRFDKGDLKIYGPLLKMEPLLNFIEDASPEVQFNDFNAASR